MSNINVKNQNIKPGDAKYPISENNITKNKLTNDIKNSYMTEFKNDDMMKTSQTKFDMKTNVKMKEIKTNLDESGFLNMTNSEIRTNSKIAPFKVSSKFTDAINDTSITKEIIGDLNKSTMVIIIILNKTSEKKR